MTLIRPFIYVSEKQTKSYIRKNNIKIMPKSCPMDGYSKREDMKKLIWDLSKSIPTIRANLYGAIKRSSIKGWQIKNGKMTNIIFVFLFYYFSAISFTAFVNSFNFFSASI